MIKIAEAEKIKQSEKISKINYDIEDLKSKINFLKTTNYTEEELNNIANNINECKNNIEELNKEIEQDKDAKQLKDAIDFMAAVKEGKIQFEDIPENELNKNLKKDA